jgi:glyoxylase-like metal-dependent hydrolase (beta-lactamase superfamily II)
VIAYHCATCGAQFAPAPQPPARCPICEDARQYVPESGQRWLSPEDLAAEHRNAIREDGAYDGVGMEPRFAIGQRALLVPAGERFVLWECTPLLDDAAAAEIERRGGLAAIAISHPHYYTAMIEWAHAFACPIFIHEADQKWVLRPDPSVQFWSGETHSLGGGVTLIRCGGHYEGSQVLHWREQRALLSGDTVQVIPDRRFVSFMYSYPNLIPMPAAAVERIAAALEPFPFDTIHGAWWDRFIASDGSTVVRRSAERYVRAVTPPGLAS